MKITFLGTSHGYNEPGRFCTSSVITAGGKNYVIDAGAPIMGLLATYGFDYKDTEHIFITHAHPDHYLGLVEFTSQIERFGEFGGLHFTVHTPQEFPYEPILNYLFGNGRLPLERDEDGRLHTKNDRVSFIHYNDPQSVIFEDENIKITAIPNRHCDHSHSFLVEGEGQRVLYTGDLAKGFPDYPAILTDESAEKLDLVILEGAHTKFNQPEIMELMYRTRTKRMILTHVHYHRNSPEMIDEMRQFVKDRFPVEEAFDGMKVEIQ